MKSRETFSPAQSRAARGLLRWSQERLASDAGVQAEAIALYEAEDGGLSPEDLHRLGRALNKAGVIAKSSQIAGEGVRFTHYHPALGSGVGEPGSLPWQSGFDVE